MRKLTIILFFGLLYSCQAESNGNYAEAAYRGEESEAYSEDQTGNEIQIEDRKIIKTAHTRFQVKDLKASTLAIEQLTEKYAGFVSNMTQTNSSYSISNELTVKVPAEKLDNFLSEMEKESIFTHHLSINSQDVSEEYFDISSRLETKKAVRDRYVDILRNKAQTVEDILNAEEKIRVVQEEIESIEGRLRYLNNRTSMSTVNIDMYQEVEYVKAPQAYKKSFGTKIGEAFVTGWEIIKQLAIGIITIWPIWLILIGLFLGRKKIRSMFKK